jgi:16S rRNA (cytosine967-C5)-methyltransferase
VRWRGYLDLIISRYAAKPLQKEVRYLLWSAIYQVGFMKKAHYHVVKESVEYAKNEYGRSVAGFLNAVLRKFVNDSEFKDMPEADRIRASFPHWLCQRWSRQFGPEQAEGLLAELMREPRFALRVNTARISPEEATQRLADDGIAVTRGRFAPSALIVDRLLPVMEASIFREGLVNIQGEASQLAGIALKEAAGRMVLDACSGSGTKTHQIRELCPGSSVYSMDNNLKRLKLSALDASVLCGDSLMTPFRSNSFDTILVDAPCSSLGIIRKHPEIKWRRTKGDIVKFAKLQLAMLNSLWALLPKGGRIIYSVCSFEPEETIDVIHNLAKEKKFALENPLPFLFNKEYFISMPHETGMDGFFIARLKKL